MPLRNDHSVGFRAVLEEYQDACNWIESLGIKISTGRLSQYLSHLNTFVDLFEQGDMDAINSNISDYLLSLLESSEASMIFTAFKDTNDDGVLSRLSEFAKGPYNLNRTQHKRWRN